MATTLLIVAIAVLLVAGQPIERYLARKIRPSLDKYRALRYNKKVPGDRSSTN